MLKREAKTFDERLRHATQEFFQKKQLTKQTNKSEMLGFDIHDTKCMIKLEDALSELLYNFVNDLHTLEIHPTAVAVFASRAHRFLSGSCAIVSFGTRAV